MRFEWDPKKATTNARKHGVTFEEACEAFEDPLSIVVEETVYPDRLVLIGVSRKTRLLITVFTERGPALVRIISARKATPEERGRYEEEA